MKIGDFCLVNHPMLDAPIVIRIRKVVDCEADPNEFISEMVKLNYSDLDSGALLYNDYYHNYREVTKCFGDLKTFFENYPEYWV